MRQQAWFSGPFEICLLAAFWLAACEREPHPPPPRSSRCFI